MGILTVESAQPSLDCPGRRVRIEGPAAQTRWPRGAPPGRRTEWYQSAVGGGRKPRIGTSPHPDRAGPRAGAVGHGQADVVAVLVGLAGLARAAVHILEPGLVPVHLERGDLLAVAKQRHGA